MASIFPALALLATAGTQFAFEDGPAARLHTLSVTGTAVTYVKPDYATIEVGAFRKGSTVVQAKRECDASMAKAIEAIRKLGIKPDDIETSGYSIFPIRSRESDPIQWKVQESATIRIRDLSKVASAIDVAVLNGAPNVSNIQFGLESVAAARAKARVSAVKMATEKANELARLAGVQLNGVIAVTEDNSDRFPYMAQYNTATDMGAPGSGASINPGRQSVSLTVNMVFAIK